jgi:heme-degrading monooxygenase HmoA
MIEIISEFVVKDEKRGQFELAYGPGGLWSKLFARAHGFRGTTLLRDVENPRKYLTIDLWNSLAHWEQVLAGILDDYSDLETSFSDLVESKTEVGIFRVLAEGTVHPRRRGLRSKPGVASRRNRGLPQ